MITRIAQAALLFSLPLLASAATFREFVNGEVVPFIDTVIQLFYAIAFVFFLIGVYRFFIAGGAESRQEGKSFMLWSIIALVVMFGIWGLVRILLSIFPSVQSV